MLQGYEENVIATIGKAVLSGLHYMHPRGFIHRDIKGENVLVDAEGHVMLADFGVTAAMEPRPTSPKAGSSPSPSAFDPSTVSCLSAFDHTAIDPSATDPSAPDPPAFEPSACDPSTMSYHWTACFVYECLFGIEPTTGYGGRGCGTRQVGGRVWGVGGTANDITVQCVLFTSLVTCSSCSCITTYHVATDSLLAYVLAVTAPLSLGTAPL